MAPKRPLDVVLCWHLHQPEYRDLDTGEYVLPWTYLHVIKDYVDMIAHLERYPDARAVFNFSPVLLEQIEDYAAQARDMLEHDIPGRDPHLGALYATKPPPAATARAALIVAWLNAHKDRMIGRYPAYTRLTELATAVKHDERSACFLSDQYCADLITWHHLAWLGDTVKRSDTRVKRLLRKEVMFTHGDRRELLQVIEELLSQVLGRYRRLLDTGQIEISVSPYAHPMVPLLTDIRCAREAMPDAALPNPEAYPDGRERARFHIERARQVHTRIFGSAPLGCWPSEGGVSDAALELLGEAGFQWAASGDSVLHNSLAHQARASAQEDGDDQKTVEDQGVDCIHRPYRFGDASPWVFFRDDGLSDLIGFDYSSWHGDDAVANFAHHLENIGNACEMSLERGYGEDGGGGVVSIILDGENAWEHYPDNGYYFLDALYAQLSTNPRLRLRTFAEIVAERRENAPQPLDRLIAGSWVYGTFSTWIGSPDKNRGWELLIAAKARYDEITKNGHLSVDAAAAAAQQLAICEGSDWFWWFGDYNSADSVASFESLYRRHLTNLYAALGEEPPAELSRVISLGHGDPEGGGSMRRGSDSDA